MVREERCREAGQNAKYADPISEPNLNDRVFSSVPSLIPASQKKRPVRTRTLTASWESLNKSALQKELRGSFLSQS
jgi:hypothetical protein